MDDLIVNPITLGDLTSEAKAGLGVFDVLMRAQKVHLEQEFKQGRIKGPEFATVYLGSLEAILTAATAFLLQKDKSYQEAQLIGAQISKVNAEIELVRQQAANAVVEKQVLEAQVCKLKAEYDAIVATLEKTAEEKELLRWKTITEKAQTTTTGVDMDSVIGKQKALYAAQTEGFARDAEQKAAKAMLDTWSVRRTTDSATVADDVNKLNDAAIGRAVEKLLTGVGA
jgi:regulator of replication initiation timing